MKTMNEMESGKPLVLVIEDSAAQAMYLEEILQDAHFRVELAGGVEEWRRLRETVQPDVVILDVMLPDPVDASSDETFGGFLSGIAVHKEMREYYSGQGQSLPAFVVLTAIRGGRTALYDRARAHFAVAAKQDSVEWMDKPIDVRVLIDILQKLTRTRE